MSQLLPIIITEIAHQDQRYETVGDYQVVARRLLITVSALPDPRYAFLVAFHELVEATLVRERGLPIDSIDQFDVAYEAVRKPGDDSEPGDHPAAPYHREHVFATKMEKLMAAELGVTWDAYDAAIKALSQSPAEE